MEEIKSSSDGHEVSIHIAPKKRRVRVKSYHRNQIETSSRILNIMTENRNTKYLRGDSIISIDETNAKPIISK